MAQVSGPLGAKFGRDPVQFTLAVVRRELSLFRRLTARLSERTGITSWTTSGPHPFRSRMVASTSDNVVEVATILVLWCIKAPQLTLDESGRMAFNLPVGPKSKAKLDGSEDVQVLPNSGWPQIYGSGEKGEDPISAGAILTIAIPIILSLAPYLLPLLIGLIGGLVGAVTGTDPTKPKAPPPDTSGDKIFGVVPTNIGLVVGAAALGYALLHKGG